MNYACDFSQSETEKYFEWMLIVIANSLWASIYTSRCNTFVEEVCNSRFLCTSTKSPFLGTGPKLTLLLHSDGVLNLISRAKKQIKSCSPGKRKRVVIYCKQFFSPPVLYGVRENYSLPKLTHVYDALTSYIRREGHLYEVFLVFGSSQRRWVLFHADCAVHTGSLSLF